jgi:hypothetical protein
MAIRSWLAGARVIISPVIRDRPRLTRECRACGVKGIAGHWQQTTAVTPTRVRHKWVLRSLFDFALRLMLYAPFPAEPWRGLGLGARV